MGSIRLMLVDDHEVVRTGLKTFLELQSNFNVVAEAGNGRDAIALALDVRPDIILMDIAMPIMSGLEATRILKSQWPEAAVLALVDREDKHCCLGMLAAGASGCLAKCAAPEELVQAIYSVKEKHIYLKSPLDRWLLDDYQRLVEVDTCPIESKNRMTDLHILSKRECGVLEFVADGMTNQQIGQCMRLSPKTIARHRERMMSKLNMHSRTELVKFAIRMGLASAK